MKSPITWVCSAGGPLILAPAEIASLWRGIEGSSSSEDRGESAGEIVSDYERTGDVDDYLGVLEVGPGKALILGDEPMQTAFVPQAGGGLIVRWGYAKNEDAVWRAVGDVPESAWESTPHRLEVAHDGLLMFDAACPGNDLPPPEEDGPPASWSRIELPTGAYLIDTADFEPDGSTWLILHRLRERRADFIDETPGSG